MASLSPESAAIIAEDVYALRDNDVEKAMKLSKNGLGLGSDFVIARGFRGTSGPLIFKTSTGFGYVAEGQGARSGEVLVAIRGTVPSIQDIGTDFNIGLQIGPSGWPVHAGFNDTFKSFKGDLKSYFANKNPSQVHCVGHSLGGALATLVADYITHSNIAAASLYTFGSPRTGIMGFSHGLTKKLGAENIYRVHHKTDPVPMIPLFPFSHVPVSSPDIMLEPFKDGIINPSAHSMENYVSSVKGTAWSGLRSGAVDIDWSERSKKWLESASSEGTLMFGVKSLWMIKQALDWLLKKVMVGVVGTAMAVSCTFIDQLAWLLHQGAQAAIETGEYVESLIARIMQFLGRTVVVGQRLTVAFIRWVLSSLGSALYNIASRSLSMLNIR